MKEKRNLSGIYLRIERDNNWDNICFEDLEDKEQDRILKNKSIEWITSLAITLADTLNKIGNQFDIKS